ncbi:hypothetical protein [Streptomyces sp. ODS28]|uniref:hypothetical protein n=1 Tax=Streptomyces sp. ODS28 TaxID=3136688 RepID=UPI0031EF78E0
MNEPTADMLDREQLEQLHAATLKASEACLELKKLCAAVLVPLEALVAAFNDRKPSLSLFAAGILVIAAFWIADSFSYFYQRKLRGSMHHIWQRRAQRCAEHYPHVPAPGEVSPARAAFNASMVYYLALGTLVCIAAACYSLGWSG